MSAAAPIRVKVLSREAPGIWERQLPGNGQRWGRCRFSFAAAGRDYDWLVVYDDLPPLAGERRSRRVEELACPRAHTLLVTTEPASIKTYGRAYTDQFGCVLTSQEPRALPHPDRVYAQPALRWFYGMGGSGLIGWDELAAMAPPHKTRDISLVWSDKRQRHTRHRQRHDFMRRLRAALPELDVYGRGGGDIRALDDKAGALDAYRCHVAIENHVSPHHWTEKLADAFLGYTLPFYYGCPNVTDYFPADSLVPIDITDFDRALSTIKAVLAGDDEYERRLPAIREARRRVLEEYNFFAVVAGLIEARHARAAAAAPGGRLYSRYALRRARPGVALQQAWEKARARARYLVRRW